MVKHLRGVCLIFVLSIFTFFSQGITSAEISEQFDALPIKRQTESEAKDEMMKALSGKGEMPQMADQASPEPDDENYGKPVSAFIVLDEIDQIFVPYNSRFLSDSRIKSILENAVIVKYEELTSLHLIPAKYITIIDKSGNHYELSLFEVSDQRGMITLLNQQRFWFAVMNK